MYTPKYNMLYPYNVTCMDIFSADHLILDKHHGTVFPGEDYLLNKFLGNGKLRRKLKGK